MYLPRERIDDELNVLCRDPFDCLLYDMVAILIFDALEHLMFEFLYQGRLLIGENVFECLSQSTC